MKFSHREHKFDVYVDVYTLILLCFAGVTQALAGDIVVALACIFCLLQLWQIQVQQSIVNLYKLLYYKLLRAAVSE